MGLLCIWKVLEGMETVDEIAKVKTRSYGPHQDVPNEPIIIKSYY